MKEEREDEKGKEVCKESESLLLCKLVFPRRKVPPSLTVTVVMDVMRLCPWAASPQCGNMQAIEGLENYFCQLVGCIYPGQVGRLLGCMPIASVFTWGWLGGGVLPKRGRKQQTSNTIHIHPLTNFHPQPATVNKSTSTRVGQQKRSHREARLWGKRVEMLLESASVREGKSMVDRDGTRTHNLSLTNPLPNVYGRSS